MDPEAADDVELETVLALGRVVVGDVAPGAGHPRDGRRHHGAQLGLEGLPAVATLPLDDPPGHPVMFRPRHIPVSSHPGLEGDLTAESLLDCQPAACWPDGRCNFVGSVLFPFMSSVSLELDHDEINKLQQNSFLWPLIVKELSMCWARSSVPGMLTSYNLIKLYIL